MRGVFDSVSNSIPHIRVATVQVHLHPQARFLLFVFAILHSFKLTERLLDGPVSVHARDGVTLAHTSVFLNLLSYQKRQHKL